MAVFSNRTIGFFVTNPTHALADAYNPTLAKEQIQLCDTSSK
jgi:hypothetical protein